jgi:hypothetical protein
VKVAPPAVNVAVRAAVVVFASTEYPTVAVPVPLAAEVMCSHDAELLKIHAAVAGLTCNCVLPVPAPAAGDAVAGEKTYVAGSVIVPLPPLPVIGSAPALVTDTPVTWIGTEAAAVEAIWKVAVARTPLPITV